VSRLLGWLLVTLIVTAAGAQELTDRIVAVVDEDPIFLSDVETALAEELYVRSLRGEPVPQDDTQLSAMKQDIVERLIDRRIVIAKARDMGIEVTRTEIEDALDQWLTDVTQAAGSEAAFMGELERQGITLKDFKARSRKDIEEELLVNRFMRQEFSLMEVSESEIRNFYDTKYDSIPELPERVGLSHIIIVPKISGEREAMALDRVERIVERLDAGEAFETVAAEMSEDLLTRSDGGAIGLVPLEDLKSEIAEIARGLEPGEVSSPIRTAYGFEIVKLSGVEEDKYRLSHILVGLRPSREDTVAAVQLASEIESRLASGESFESLAKQYSDDDRTRESGGYVGELEMDALEDAYRLNIAGLEAGEVSGVIATRHGFQILKVASRTASRKASFDEAREWIRSVIESRRRETLFAGWLDQARSEVFVKRYEF
jgi:peptidyl-prolyl cis-trans isomerase SurA